MVKRGSGDHGKAARREEILDAAEAVFFDKGFDRSAMEKIARRAGISRALLYVYFTDKAAILRGIMHRASLSMGRRFERAMTEGHSGLDQLRGIGEAYYAFSCDESDYFDVLTNMNIFPTSGEEDDQAVRLRDSVAHNTGLMVRAIEAGLADGSLRADRISSPAQTAYFLQGALHGIIMQTRGPRITESGQDGAALVRYAIDMLGCAIQAE